jgi:hypothetical protein
MSVVRPCIRSLQTDCPKQHKMISGITEIGKRKYQLFKVYSVLLLLSQFLSLLIFHFPFSPQSLLLLSKFTSTRYFACCCFRYFHVLSPFIFLFSVFPYFLYSYVVLYSDASSLALFVVRFTLFLLLCSSFSVFILRSSSPPLPLFF